MCLIFDYLRIPFYCTDMLTNRTISASSENLQKLNTSVWLANKTCFGRIFSFFFNNVGLAKKHKINKKKTVATTLKTNLVKFIYY